jgi:hypothetical protein
MVWSSMRLGLATVEPAMATVNGSAVLAPKWLPLIVILAPGAPTAGESEAIVGRSSARARSGAVAVAPGFTVTWPLAWPRPVLEATRGSAAAGTFWIVKAPPASVLAA